MFATYKGKLELVKWLCEIKADTECKSEGVRMMYVFAVLDVVHVNVNVCAMNGLMEYINV